ncbi:MAG TPA: protein translocase subunit SecF [Abditibacteriaceae bacterium]|jgi:preprotein translocase subunit SecF
MDFRGKNIDLVGKTPLWFGISLALMLIGLVSLVSFGLNLGIDFKGGGQLTYRIPAAKRPSGNEIAFQQQVRGALGEKAKVAKVQVAGGDTLIIQTDARDESELRAQERTISASLAQQFGEKELRPIAQERVGPVIGEELRRSAIWGVTLGVLFIAAWIYIRYNFAGDGLRYAVAGITALLHDVFVLVGLFALIGRIDPRIEIDGAFIAALLTVVGYSINDSVVIFDRIRENLRLRRRDPYLKVVNDSLLETMSRSVNTGMTVLIMLFALLFFGGGAIYNFILAMLIGIASGLYSSIFNASMVLVAWHNADEKKTATATPRTATAPRTPARPASPSAPVAAPPVASGSLATRALQDGEVAGETAEARARRESLKARSKRRF